GQYVQLRLTTSSTGDTALTATLAVGYGVTDQWSARTFDDVPDAFDFTNTATTSTRTVTTSGIVQITGISVAATITISGGGSPQYQTCSTSNCSSVIQSWTSSSFTISNNQYLQLRATSPASAGSVTVTINVGSGSDIWRLGIYKTVFVTSGASW